MINHNQTDLSSYSGSHTKNGPAPTPNPPAGCPEAQLMLEGNKGHLAKNTSLFCLVKQPFEQHIGNQRGIQLVKDRIRCRAKQHRHIQVLLDPAEKRFNRPARCVHLGHFFSRHIHQAGQDADFPLVVILEKHTRCCFSERDCGMPRRRITREPACFWRCGDRMADSSTVFFDSNEKVLCVCHKLIYSADFKTGTVT